ncbi:MAG TPA: adenylate/guanylate cyclase domain-containing protein [Marmoricola sp.]
MDGAAPDRERLVELLEVFLLGDPPTLSGLDIADQVGIPIELARERWRSLGFTAVEDDAVAFTEADLQAMRRTQKLHALGLVDDEHESSLVRTLGRSFARLAEWQITLLGRAIDLDTMELEQLNALMSEVVPVIEELQGYVWRRHLLNAAARQLLSPDEADGGGDGAMMAVGFADIVGYTRQSRSLRSSELARLVEEFEARALAVVTEFGGRIIKSIGDEVLFVADDQAAAARIGLLLAEEHRHDEDFPELRVGIAWGRVLRRLGDVYGPVVNMAARLTSIARPGRVLVDRDMAEALGDDDAFQLRKLRRTAVKGYRRLEPWSLRRSDDASAPVGPASAFLQERREDLIRAVDEMQLRPPRASGTEDAE